MTKHRIAYAALIAATVLACYLSAREAVRGSRADLEAVSVASAQQQRENSVAGCERTKADRLDAITGWDRARKAWAAVRDDPAASSATANTAAATIAVYSLVIDGYRQRIVDCQDAFPPVNTEAVRDFIRQQAR